MRSSVAGAWVRSSGWSVGEIEHGGAHCCRQSYAVVANGEHLGLAEERGNRRVRKKRKEKNEERGERKGNIK